ncbi:hypothetical protein NL676_022086 [Syzygium grande]|nr:hypothetical protein NL676_022086 [Syzygium grande]
MLRHQFDNIQDGHEIWDFGHELIQTWTQLPSTPHTSVLQVFSERIIGRVELNEQVSSSSSSSFTDYSSRFVVDSICEYCVTQLVALHGFASKAVRQRGNRKKRLQLERRQPRDLDATSRKRKQKQVALHVVIYVDCACLGEENHSELIALLGHIECSQAEFVIDDCVSGWPERSSLWISSAGALDQQPGGPSGRPRWTWPP